MDYSLDCLGHLTKMDATPIYDKQNGDPLTWLLADWNRVVFSLGLSWVSVPGQITRSANSIIIQE